MRHHTFRNILTIMLVLYTYVASESEFCRGFYEGFENGYCTSHGGAICVAPMDAICPIPKLHEDTFLDGFLRGYYTGMVRHKGIKRQSKKKDKKVSKNS